MGIVPENVTGISGWQTPHITLSTQWVYCDLTKTSRYEYTVSPLWPHENIMLSKLWLHYDLKKTSRWELNCALTKTSRWSLHCDLTKTSRWALHYDLKKRLRWALWHHGNITLNTLWLHCDLTKTSRIVSSRRHYAEYTVTTLWPQGNIQRLRRWPSIELTIGKHLVCD